MSDPNSNNPTTNTNVFFGGNSGNQTPKPGFFGTTPAPSTDNKLPAQALTFGTNATAQNSLVNSDRPNRRAEARYELLQQAGGR